MFPSEVEAFFAGWSWPKFRAKQVLEWVYQKGVLDPAAMTNLPLADRQRLAAEVAIAPAKIARRQNSADGTIKLLLQWADGANAETVMIPDGPRRTACVSSQVGCPVGCKFCASGIGGVKQNLSAARIVEQVAALNAALESRSERVTNIVFMGMGEPLTNYANVMKAIRILHDPACFNIGGRKITVSTVGVPSRMRELAKENLPLNLAISLHAPDEALRRQLIPWAEHFSMREILDAGRYYFDQTGREITLEYILLAGVNDRPEHAQQLSRICKTLRANVNLLRFNQVPGLPFARPESADVMAFQAILRQNGVNAHVRKSRGRDIDAACGQLRRRHEQTSPPPLSPSPGTRVAESPGRREGKGEGSASAPSPALAGEGRGEGSSSPTPQSPAQSSAAQKPPRAFTIVELLVSIAIFVILLSTFIPYGMRLREQSHRDVCADNLRQLRDALHAYSDANNHVFPRVVYDAAHHPNGYCAYTGPDDPNPFAANSAVKPNDVTASLWLLVRSGIVKNTTIFICPSTDDEPDLLTDASGRFTKPQSRGNFRSPTMLSYSYATPFGSAPGYRMDDTQMSEFAIMADKNPGISPPDSDVTGPAADSPPLQMAKANSRNHFRAGQNVLFADGSVAFVKTPYCGVGRSSGVGGDNIYTALTKKPLSGEHPPANGRGFCSPNIGPAWEADSYLVPTAEDGMK
jgi:23S rRNA (adenine2503-C2)-methyltransferase